MSPEPQDDPESGCKADSRRNKDSSPGMDKVVYAEGPKEAPCGEGDRSLLL